MEEPPGNEAAVGQPAGTEAPDHGEALKASDEAIAFMSSIEPAELQKCVFADSLVALSEGDRELGNFSVTVEFACRGQQPCMRLQAQSQGAIDECPCGTKVTAYLAADLEVLEEDYCEYIELKGHCVDKRFHMVQRHGQMVINRSTTVGEKVTKDSASYPLSALRGLITEGSNFLLMRLIALRRKVPPRMTFISLYQGLHIVHTTFSELGLKQMDIEGETVEIFGVERTVHSLEEPPASWQCYFVPDGHMVSRVHVGSPVIMRLMQQPSQRKKDFEKIPLVWEADMQMCSKFLERKEELKGDNASYLRQHPEIRALISDFLQFLLLRKPDDVFQFAREYFLPFASHAPLEPSQSL